MRKLIILIFSIMLFAACSSIDCPLSSTVYTKYKLAGDVLSLPDTLTISTRIPGGDDSILINKDVNADSFNLPISYQRMADTLYFKISDINNITTIDTIAIEKTNLPHFESVDCSPGFFHYITAITYTNNRIDSVVINNPNVTYDASKTHFFIYFKTNSY